MNFQEVIRRLQLSALTMAVILLPYSITYCHFFILLFIVSTVLRGWNSDLISHLRNPVLILFMIFFLLHVIGIFYSADKKEAWFDLEKKIFLFVLPLVFCISHPFSKEEINRVFKWFILSCLVATFTCLYNSIMVASQSGGVLTLDSITQSDFYSPAFSNKWKFFTYGYLGSGIGINPSYFSLYLVFCLLLIVHLYGDRFATQSIIIKISVLITWLYVTIFIILLSSRIMILPLLMINAYASFTFFRNTIRLRKITLTLSTLCLLLFLLYLNPVSRYRNEEIVNTSKTFELVSVHAQSVSIRASLWWLGIKTFQSGSPVWGCGTGDVLKAMEATGKQHRVSNVLDTSNPHNQFLYTLIGLGLTGFITLLCFLGLPVVFAWQQKKFFYLGFALTFCLLCITESALEVQKGIAFFAIFNSLLVFQYGDLKVPSLKQPLYG